jgi:gliding motility-associated-like protein
VNPLPNVNAGADQAICIGASTSISGSGASSYTWDNGVTNGAPFSPVTTNTYTVTGTDANGCVNTDQVVVTVNPLPTIDAGADQTVCNGTTVTFTASGAGAGGTYSWTNGIANGVPFTPPLGTNTYTVTGTDANGCQNTDQAAVTVNPVPVVNAGPDQSVCIGSSVTLTASGASTYTWDNGVSNGVAFTPAVGSITYTVTGSSLSCSAIDQVVVTVNPLPNVNAGNDVIVCESGSVILTASGAQTYTWNNGVNDGISFTAPLDTTQYTVTGTDANGCQNTDTLVVNVIPTPVVDFVGDKLKGCSPLTTTFTNNSMGNLTNCKWSFSNGQLLTGCGTVTATFNAVGCYDATLTVSTPEGCTNTMTIADYVCVVPDPIADFYTDPEELSTEQWTANMVNTSVNGTGYQWTFGDGSSTSTAVAPSHDYPNAQSGSYEIQLIATSADGCTDTTTRVITLKEDLIFYVPNSFTPDNDAFNPSFKPVFTTGYDPYHYTLYIFNRWGEILFESHNTEVGWDGTYGGKLVEDGVYIWKINVKRRDSDEKVERVGHVSVLK